MADSTHYPHYLGSPLCPCPVSDTPGNGQSIGNEQLGQIMTTRSIGFESFPNLKDKTVWFSHIS